MLSVHSGEQMNDAKDLNELKNRIENIHALFYQNWIVQRMYFTSNNVVFRYIVS